MRTRRNRASFAHKKVRGSVRYMAAGRMPRDRLAQVLMRADRAGPGLCRSPAPAGEPSRGRVEDTEIRCRIGAWSCHPLPVAGILGEIGLSQRVPEPILAVAPAKLAQKTVFDCIAACGQVPPDVVDTDLAPGEVGLRRDVPAMSGRLRWFSWLVSLPLSASIRTWAPASPGCQWSAMPTVQIAVT